VKQSLVAILIVFAVATWVQAAPQPSDAIDRELFAPDPKKPPEPASPASPASKGQVGPSAIVEEMLQAARRIRQSDAGPVTQDLQRRIVAGLEELLRQAGQQQGDSSQTARAKSSQQTKAESRQESGRERDTGKPKPGAQPNPGEAPSGRDAPNAAPLDAADRAALVRRVWGDLPERQRNEILQLQPPEEFLPKYELQIEAYFKRLSEPRSGVAGSGSGDRRSEFGDRH